MQLLVIGFIYLATLYVLVTIILLVSRDTIREKYLEYIERHKLHVYTLLFALLLLWVGYVYLRIGGLPYGPDTASYTSATHYLRVHGKWDSSLSSHYNPYYRLIHIPIFEYHILSVFTGTPYAYPVMVSTILLSTLLLARSLIARLGSRPFSLPGPIFLAILLALFLASPPMGGLDIIPQIYSVALSLLALFFAAEMTRANNSASRENGEASGGSLLVALSIFSSFAAIMSHLTGVVLILAIIVFILALSASATATRKNMIRIATVASIMAVIYVVYIASMYSSLANVFSVFSTLEKIIRGELSHTTVSIRAYSELASSREWLLSWALLPAIFASVVSITILRFIIRRRNSGTRNAFLASLAVTTFLFLLVAAGIASRLANIELLRYFLVPSYYIAYVAALTLLLMLYQYRKKLVVPKYLLLLLILATLVAAISGIHDPARAPWNGGTRLAPVTLEDRLEVEAIEHLFGGRTAYLSVHDIYLDFNTIHLKSIVRDYYTADRLIKYIVGISNDSSVNIAKFLGRTDTSLLVFVYRDYITAPERIKYNLVVVEKEHAVLHIPRQGLLVEQAIQATR